MNFEDYNEFAEWADEQGYDYDNEIDRTEESHKRDTIVTFFMKKEDSDLYAQVAYVSNYDYGSSDFDVVEGLKRVEELVTVTQVRYV